VAGVWIIHLHPGDFTAMVGGVVSLSGIASVVGTFLKGTKETWMVDNNPGKPTAVVEGNAKDIEIYTI